MLQPKRTKFRKQFKGRIKGEAKGGSDLNFGTFGLKATQPERITARQIEETSGPCLHPDFPGCTGLVQAHRGSDG